MVPVMSRSNSNVSDRKCLFPLMVFALNIFSEVFCLLVCFLRLDVIDTCCYFVRPW